MSLLAVACIVAMAGGVAAQDPPPGTEIVVNDAAITESDSDYVEATGDEGTITCLMASAGDEDTLFLTITTQEYEIHIDDFTVLEEDTSLGMHWSGQIDGQSAEGGLVVGPDTADGATIKLLAGAITEPDFLVSLTSTAEAAQALVRLWIRGSFGVDPGEDGGLGDAAWWWTWYCGCRWGVGNMTLCASGACTMPTICPPTSGSCHWFAVWGVMPDWANTTGDE